jgi:hypothetical protein
MMERPVERPGHPQSRSITTSERSRSKQVKSSFARQAAVVFRCGSRPGDTAAQIRDMFDRLTADPEAWSGLREKHSIFVCGVFMASSNGGLEFEPDPLHELA